MIAKALCLRSVFAPDVIVKDGIAFFMKASLYLYEPWCDTVNAFSRFTITSFISFTKIFLFLIQNFSNYISFHWPKCLDNIYRNSKNIFCISSLIEEKKYLRRLGFMPSSLKIIETKWIRVFCSTFRKIKLQYMR